MQSITAFFKKNDGKTQTNRGREEEEEIARKKVRVEKVTVVDKVYKFNPDWLKDFGGLLYDAENMKMFCTFCKEAPSAMAGSSLFRTGNPNLKRDAVVKQSESVRHSRCRDLYINHTQSNNPGTVEAAVGRQVAISNQDALRQLKVKFTIGYVIAKEEIAFTKFGPRIALHHKNGFNINPTYDNDVRCAEMVGQTAEGIKDTLAAQLQAARYLAVLIDGDTDISNTECEIVYVRFVEDGRPVTRLVGQQALLHAHAQGVLVGTNAAFEALGRGKCDWKV
ncbi:uncharacterized protein LOC130401795 [Gadus chalcogrammus]|uniref:uncharacterized protein LOC130401795 n=1 Tax=Gadus chalcogrammus TaxID=1042646 RepID=UPI0024C4A488|nr:uncharacterized protein LOC130401795 [Gadus chalcogrammus]